MSDTNVDTITSVEEELEDCNKRHALSNCESSTSENEENNMSCASSSSQTEKDVLSQYSSSNSNSSDGNLYPMIWQKFQFLLSILKDIQINILEIEMIIKDHQVEENANRAHEVHKSAHQGNENSLDGQASKTDETKLGEVVKLLHGISQTLACFDKHSVMDKENSENPNMAEKNMGNSKVRDFVSLGENTDAKLSIPVETSQVNTSKKDKRKNSKSKMLPRSKSVHDDSTTSNTNNSKSCHNFENLPKSGIVLDEEKTKTIDVPDRENSKKNELMLKDLKIDESEVLGLGESGLSDEIDSLSASINDIIHENKALCNMVDVITTKLDTKQSTTNVDTTSLHDSHQKDDSFTRNNKNVVKVTSEKEKEELLLTESAIIKDLREENKHCNETCRKLEKMVLDLWKINRTSRLRFLQDLQSFEFENDHLTQTILQLKKSSNLSTNYDNANREIQNLRSVLPKSDAHLIHNKALSNHYHQDQVDANDHTVMQSSSNSLNNLASPKGLRREKMFLSLPNINDSSCTLVADVSGSLSQEINILKTKLLSLEQKLFDLKNPKELPTTNKQESESNTEQNLIMELMDITKEIFAAFKLQKDEISQLKRNRENTNRARKNERGSFIDKSTSSIEDADWKQENTMKLLSLNGKLQEEHKYLQEQLDKAKENAHSLALERDYIAAEKEKLNLVLTTTLASIEQENKRLQASLQKFEEEKRQYMMKIPQSESTADTTKTDKSGAGTTDNFNEQNETNAHWQQAFMWLQRCIVEEKLQSQLLDAAQQENSARVALLEQKVTEKGNQYSGLLAKYKKLQLNLMANKAEIKVRKRAFRDCGAKIQEYQKTTSAIEDNYKVMLTSLGYNIGIAADLLSSHLYFSPTQIHPSPEFSSDPAFWFAAQCSRLRWIQFQLRKIGLRSWKEGRRPPYVIPKDADVAESPETGAENCDPSKSSKMEAEKSSSSRIVHLTSSKAKQSQSTKHDDVQSPNFSILSELNDTELRLSSEQTKLEKARTLQFNQLLNFLRRDVVDVTSPPASSSSDSFPNQKNTSKKTENEVKSSNLPTDCNNSLSDPSSSLII